MPDIMPPPPPKRSLPDRPVGWELLLFILVLLLIVVVGTAILAAVGDVAFGPQGAQVLQRIPAPGDIPHAWIHLGAYTVFYCAILAATWIAMFPHGERRASALGLRPSRWQWIAFGTVAVLALSQLLDAFMLPFLQDILAVGSQELLITQVVRAVTATPMLAIGAIVVLGLLGPIVEELVFRGLLYGWLRGFLPFALVAILTSALFGLIHGEWAHAIVAGLLGLVLAFIRERSGSLWPPIVAHAVNNLIAVGAAAIFGV